MLASIQAELLRILLFGPRTVHPMSLISIDFPTALTNEFTKAEPDMSRPKMRQVLALSIGIILARCSLMPAANLDDDITEIGSNDDDSDDQLLFTSDCEPAIRLVLPKIEIWDEATCLEWDHLEPWDVSGDVGGLSNNLLVYSISLHQVVKLEGISLKRRKRSDSIKGIGSKESKNLDAKFNYLCTELAHATAQFLLETNSLDWFQRPGGVLLMVMSMAYTRGITKMKSDSDDITAKLTSSFGHCSQELINLLLTGQAGMML